MPTKRLVDDEVIEKARWIWEHGVLHRTAHFDAELKNAGASMADVEDVLFGACRIRKASWNEAHRHWRYAISGQDLNGCELHIVVSIDMGNSALILVTAF